MDAKDVVEQADEAGLRLVRFLWCGNDGTVRAKASTLRGLEGRIQSGIGLTVWAYKRPAERPRSSEAPPVTLRLVPSLGGLAVGGTF